MESCFTPRILTDRSRLDEIYQLRVNAYENSPSSKFINRSVFPDGWNDSLDDKANHWVIEHEGKIMASSRLCMISNLSIIEENYHQFGLPVTGNYAFFSRLVVDSKFRKIGLAHRMDKVRLEFIIANNIELTLAWARNERLPSLYKLGFKDLGNMSLTFGAKKEIVSAVLLDCSTLVKGKALNYGNPRKLKSINSLSNYEKAHI